MSANGGPAFPVITYDVQPDTGMQVVRWQEDGMSLRDYLAARALPEEVRLCSTRVASPFYRLRLWLYMRFPIVRRLVRIPHAHVSNDEASAAAQCYRYADAMLAERAKAKL